MARRPAAPRILTINHLALAAVVALVALTPLAAAQPIEEPAAVASADAGAAGQWTLRSEHLIWGMPRQTDNRHNIVYPGESQPRPGLSVLVREGFVVGHYDLYRVPAWVSVRWTSEDHDRLQPERFGRPFAPDKELPRYARAGTSYNNATSHMERGHMARHEDNEAWGEDNSAKGCLMSNIVPQHEDMNGEAWNDREDMHQKVVTDPALGIDRVWVISGPLFGEDGLPEFTVGNAVAVPKATYKVIGWFDGAGEFHARGYIVGQGDRVRKDPGHYLRSIREIEEATGLDFFPELPKARADAIEEPKHADLWGEHAGALGPRAAGQVEVRIVALLPNPVGDEREDEAVTLRNVGAAPVRLDGWLLRDAAGATWSLSGTIEPGDERTFLRSGQAMALNNSGPERVELLGPDRSIADSVRYDGATAGQVLREGELR